MAIRDVRREAAIEAMADHLLRAGLVGASLRSLAASAGISDRMLLYYFADKDDVLAATLERLAERITGLLDQALPASAPIPMPIFIQAVWTAVRSPDLQPFLHIWLELAAGAARGQAPHREIGGGIADGFLDWASQRLDAPASQDREQAAATLLALMEGMVLLDAVGRPQMADAAAAGLQAAIRGAP